MKRITLSTLAFAALLLVSCERRTTDYTRGTSDRCEVHGVRMTKAGVPIEYGLVRLSELGKALQIARDAPTAPLLKRLEQEMSGAVRTPPPPAPNATATPKVRVRF